LVEHHDGRWEIVTWTKEKDNVGTINISSSYERPKGHTGTSGVDISGQTLMRTKFTKYDILVKV